MGWKIKVKMKERKESSKARIAKQVSGIYLPSSRAGLFHA
jgi:hypothetical protein